MIFLGFVKLALEHGVDILPGYNFGETQLYTASTFLLAFRQKWSRKLNVALLWAHGPYWWCPVWPHETQLVQVFGKPIVVLKTIRPTVEDIDTVHAAYVTELRRIFDTYKGQYGYGSKELIIY